MFNLTSIKDDEAILIGGSWDGERVSFGVNRKVIQLIDRRHKPDLVTEINCHLSSGPVYRIEIYRRSMWVCGKQEFTLWISEDLTELEAFVRLLSGYCPALLLNPTQPKEH